MGEMLCTEVTSFTKQRSYNVVISKEYLKKGDRVLFIDDFLAYGNAAKGIIDLVKQADAELVGMGFIIEKAFQDGGNVLRKIGHYRIIRQLRNKIKRLTQQSVVDGI